MNNIEVINDNIINVKSGIIAHCVNCQGKMGSGVAKALYTRWPRVKESYLEAFNSRFSTFTTNFSSLLGEVDYVNVSNSLVIANCFAQEYYGYDSKRYGSIVALEQCLSDVATQCIRSNLALNVPYKLASDRAGLDWDKEVFPFLKHLNEKYNIKIVIWKYNGE